MVKPEIFPINLPVMWEFSVTWVGLPCEFFRMTWSIKKSLFQEDKVSLKDSKPQVDRDIQLSRLRGLKYRYHIDSY